MWCEVSFFSLSSAVPAGVVAAAPGFPISMFGLDALTFFFIPMALFYELVKIAVATLFLLVGVANRVSAEELLSLSVESMLSEVATIPSLPERPLFVVEPPFSSLVRASMSLLVLILATILFAFHWVQIKLYSSHSSKSPIDHQKRAFRQFLTRIELFPLPI